RYQRGAGFDRRRATVPRQQKHVRPSSRRRATRAVRDICRQLDALPRRLVRELKDLREFAAERFVLRPARETLRRGIDESDATALVRRDDCIADASERRREPALALTQTHLRAMFVERRLDGRTQLALLEWLEQIAQRLCHLRASKRAVVGVC